MGQIEELEYELTTIQYQVDRIQKSLDKSREMIGNIKQNQENLMAQQAAMAQRLKLAEANNQVAPQPMQQMPVQPQQVPVVQQVPVQQVPVQPVQQQVPVQPIQQQAPVQQPQPRPAQAAPVQQPVYRVVQPGQVMIQPNSNQNQQKRAGNVFKPAESTESWIGKHLMSIFASVLIFVALVLFASLIIPYLGDGVKITMMFTASIGISAFAYYMHKKKPENSLFTALLACGIGCCYISILVTRMSFEAIGDVTMYVLMLIWGAAVLFLARKENWLFQVIGNAGFVISSLLAFAIDDEALIIPLLAYLIIMGGAHLYIFWKNDLQRKIQCGVNLAIMAQYSCVLRFAFDGGTAYTIAFVIMTILALAAFVCFTFGDLFKEKTSNPYFALASAAVLAITYFGILSAFDTPDIVRVIGLLAIGVAAEVAMIMTDKKDTANNYSLFSIIWISVWLVIASIFAYSNVNEFFDTGILYLFLAPLALWGIKTGNKYYKWQAFVIAAILAVIEVCGGESVMFSIMAFAFALLVFVIEAFILNDSAELKLTYYVFTLINLLIMMYAICGRDEITGDWKTILMTVPAGLFNAVMILRKLDRNAQGESNHETWTMLNVLNVVGMLVGLFSMVTFDEKYTASIALVYTVTLASINLKHHIEGTSDERLYAGIKYGVILLAALYSYDAKGYVASVFILVYAIICILIGFNKKYGAKELRVYGLVISMICVVKFIMFDTTYENTLGHALSFLISGILCFGISAIYNHFEKREVTDTLSQDNNESSQISGQR